MQNHTVKKLACAAAAALFGIGLNSSTASASLVAYYPLDGNLNDASGNNNNGVVPSGATSPTFAQAVPGTPVTWARFSAAQTAINISNPLST